MATFQFRGIDEYIARLSKLIDEPRETIGRAIYAGADVVADAIRRELNSLPVGDRYAQEGEKINTVTAAQKAGLSNGLGIAKMRQDGTAHNVKVGFTGYNNQHTRSYPGGQPNSLIARSVCSGTSFRAKNDFVGRGARSAKAHAEQAMKNELDNTYKKIMN